jgi:hypothetical protein
MLYDAKNTTSGSTLGSIVLHADDVIERPEIIAAFPSSQLWSCNHDADTRLHAPRYGTAGVLEHGMNKRSYSIATCCIFRLNSRDQLQYVRHSSCGYHGLQ